MRCQKKVISVIVGESGNYERQCRSEAGYHPVLALSSRDGSEIQFVCPVVVCPEHALDADPVSALGEDDLDEIEEAASAKIVAAGGNPLDRSRTRLSYAPISDPRAALMRRMQAEGRN